VADHDAVVVGSGINSLACAALLSRAGWDVCVLERSAHLGGAIQTTELTEPGYHHDVFSAWHPLWVGGAAHAELGNDLVERGLEYLHTELPTATLYPDGEAAFLLRSADANAEELDRHAEGDGDRWLRMLDAFLPDADLAFAVLGTELWSKDGLALGLKAYRRLGRRGLVEFTGEMLSSSRDWLTATFASERARGLLAPWVLHTGLGPDAAASGFMTKVIAVAIQEGGMPVPRGGGARLADGTEVTAARAVIANVTPTQLYERLLDGGVAAPGRKFRYGRSEMQIHFALSEPPRWQGDERLRRTAIVHLTPGLDGVSRAVNEAERGLLPAEATVVVGQPLTMDPSRAPDGAGMLWIQLQELPWQIKGDGAGELAVGHGTWTEDLRERYADRIQARIAAHVPNLESALRRRVVLSPADLQAANINLLQGDPYSGSLALDQNLLWRPFPANPGHATPVRRLWQIGASTHPGPGLGAGSGTLVAKRLLEPPLLGRLRRRLSR
jgi:phytoene dehydrogenase-like protein